MGPLGLARIEEEKERVVLTQFCLFNLLLGNKVTGNIKILVIEIAEVTEGGCECPT
jgi:hypothetical protein